MSFHRKGGQVPPPGERIIARTQKTSAKFAPVVAAAVLLGWISAHHNAQGAILPNAEIYGRAHASFDYLDNGADSATNVSSNSSRLGVRASTDIRDGLTGILQVESTIAYDNGSGSLANRDTFVGLQGDFGRIRLGQIDTPLKAIRGAVDFFGDQIGDARNFTRLGGNAGAPYGQDFDARFRNGVYYNTPAFGGGFVLDVHYSPDTSSDADLSGDRTAYSSALTYNTSNLYLAAAYEQWGATNDSNAFRLGARYRAGDLTIAGLFQIAEVKSLEPSEEIQTLGVGASYRVSPKVLVKGQIYALDARDRDDSGATLVALGADYILSRQFRLLFALAATDNDDLATYRVTGGGGFGDSIATVPGEVATGLSAGFRFDF